MVGGRLHSGIERGPDVDRVLGLVDQRVELRQGPVGEVANAVLLGRRLDADVAGSTACGRRFADEAVLRHRLEHDAGAVARRFDVGGRRIVGRRLDQTGDDRRLAEAEVIGAVTEELRDAASMP